MSIPNFGRRIRFLNSQEARQIPEVHAHARALYSRFGRATRQSVHDANRQKNDFYDYLSWLRVTQGQRFAFSHLDSFGQAGFSVPGIVVAINILTQNDSDFETRYSRLSNLARIHPENPYVIRVLAVTALATGRLIELERILQRFVSGMVALSDEDAVHNADTAALAGLWDLAAALVADLDGESIPAALRQRIEMGHRFRGHGSVDFSTHIINMPEDKRRLDLSTKLFAKMDINLKRFEAVDGRRLPDFARNSVVSPRALPDLGAGLIGCALSHIGVWEVVAAGTEEYALILEDDAIPFGWTPMDDILRQAPGKDLYFVNERMSSYSTTGACTGASSVWDVLGRWPGTSNGWGLDGYILTRSGASKLLSAIEEDAIIGHLDGQVGSYCVPSVDSRVMGAQATSQSVRRRMKSGVVLDAVALNFPLVKQQNFGTSTLAAVSASKI